MARPAPAKVEELCHGIGEYREFDDAIVRTRLIDSGMMLVSMYGSHVLDYIVKSLEFRATDPYSYSNEVISTLFTRVFGSRYRFSFNQVLKLEKVLLVPRIRQLVAAGCTLGAFIDAYERDKEPFVTVEIDACLHLDTDADPPRRFELKMVTFPDRSPRVLARHLAPRRLAAYFVARDYMGFITFATIHDTSEPDSSPRYNQEVPEHLRTGWFLHLAIVDGEILARKQAAIRSAEQILGAMRDDHAFLASKINLNTHVCSISLITNYVKVIHMAYVIEQLRRDLHESERRREESERRREESERRLEEERQALEREKATLLKALKDAGIPSPLDEPGRP